MTSRPFVHTFSNWTDVLHGGTMVPSKANQHGLGRKNPPILPFILSVTFALMMTQIAYATRLTKLQAKLPSQIAGWKAETDDRVFDDRTIFEYINGAGEVYKAYNMRLCLSRQYVKRGEPKIILDIFDMGSSADAFGVFTHDTDGDIIAVGQDARYRPGWLSFWQQHYFVSIYMEEESPAAEQAVKELGLEIAKLIGGKGNRPRLLKRFPDEGLITGSIRYLHHPIVLNYHFYISDENILNISPQTEAALAAYKRKGQKALILLVSYSQTDTATRSKSDFLQHYLPDVDSGGAALLENGKWSAVRMKGKLLAIVLEADNRQLADTLLAAVNLDKTEEQKP